MADEHGDDEAQVMTLKDLPMNLSNLHLDRDSILVIYVPLETRPDAQRTIKSMARSWLREQHLDAVRILLIVGQMSLLALDEKQMQKCGWVRAEAAVG